MFIVNDSFEEETTKDELARDVRDAIGGKRRKSWALHCVCHLFYHFHQYVYIQRHGPKQCVLY